MFRRYLLTGLVAGFLSISSTLYAGESEIILKDNTTASGLTVKEETANTTIARFRGDGNVGIGTTEPATKLDITHVNSDADLGLYLRGSSAPNTRITSIWSGSIGTVIDAKGVASGSGLHFYIDGSEKVRIDNNGNVGIGTTAPSEKLEVSGNIKASGTVSQGSSRELKKNISYISTKEAMKALNGLKPVRFEYKADNFGEEHLGFIAEDVPELVAEQDRKHLNPMDLTAVFAKVIQEQQKMLQDQKETIDAMKREMEMMKSAMNYGAKGL